ncbi:ribosomal L7Ae/L30e/S12e/Gadd45 family protein [Facklamia sp. DSM 111018]|uniref:Ribosomal L7Ae/L30e/S12e/Gadd45 family protein n=1 Tax=Facklamia lactis TaxID=2749967 RepID=A0ABS0LMN5_9LACT|nr:ribosomal L7Ae/L30e/S12e/Gadd45 family protein [Facklamia lactis]MBG9980021.1 ribosomal L7Ae/L30e/S12e/Gadd45 family protein [Facklamia lactis]MBG9985299.1 ribosomal L7Ae/L30e/S12e/Gadd45 family protein [Facklamia lactis]
MIFKQKQLNLLGLSLRASKLISGDEQVEKGIKKGKVHLILVANDASSATKERYQKMSVQYNVPIHINFNRYEISHAIGKSRTICGITDHGISQKFLSYVTGVENMNDK